MAPWLKKGLKVEKVDSFHLLMLQDAQIQNFTWSRLDKRVHEQHV